MNKLIMVLGALLVMLIAMFMFNGGDDKGDAAVTDKSQSKPGAASSNGATGKDANVTTEERDDYVNTLKTISARSLDQEKRIA
ncbi:MAG: hypothetical protein QG652_1219, partial [Pseudomonadota bacterium]|nr:hypothetical protein [Pseudomonadota bacterium]